jgi:hypothetical protein
MAKKWSWIELCITESCALVSQVCESISCVRNVRRKLNGQATNTSEKERQFLNKERKRNPRDLANFLVRLIGTVDENIG